MSLISYDLHIHSCLSPCADDDMTPHNVINMAKIKGLDVIGIVDHNTTLNLEAFINVAKKLNMNIIPGIEIETKEELHILLFFKQFDIIKEFQSFIETKMSNIKNNKKIFGNQLLVDDSDNVISEYQPLLLYPLDIELKELYEVSMFYDLLFIPAHIDRDDGIIGRLGVLPEYLNEITIFEIKNIENQKKITKQRNNNVTFIFSSDAHKLYQINERINFIDKTIFDMIFRRV